MAFFITSEVTELMLVPSESPFLRYIISDGLVECTGQGNRGLLLRDTQPLIHA